MARRLRNYPREYLRRKELEAARAATEGREFENSVARGYSKTERRLRADAKEATRRLFYEIVRLVKGGQSVSEARRETGLSLSRFRKLNLAEGRVFAKGRGRYRLTHAIIETLDAVPPTIEGNREMLAWLRGEKAWHDEAEKRHRRVTLIDFEHTDSNVFHVSWEWMLKPPARKGNRADVMFLVNGVPVCIVEHKNPKDGNAIERGTTQFPRYEKETPELIGAPQLFNVTHLLEYWYGVTWNVARREMARWKQTRDEAYRFAVQAFFERTDFLRTLQHWILFYVKDSETKKSVLRQHQRRA